MRTTFSEKLEAGRIRHGRMATRTSDGGYGVFIIQGPCGAELKIVSSAATVPEAEGWEHVSVSTSRRPPNWQEMCFVKGLFWEPEECVVQFHPPESRYVNNHPHCLHLWKNIYFQFPQPSAILVGIKSEGVLTKERAQQLRIEIEDKS